MDAVPQTQRSNARVVNGGARHAGLVDQRLEGGPVVGVLGKEPQIRRLAPGVKLCERLGWS